MPLLDERLGDGASAAFTEVMQACQPKLRCIVRQELTDRGGVGLHCYWGPRRRGAAFSDSAAFEVYRSAFYVMEATSVCAPAKHNPALTAKFVELLPPLGRLLGIEWVVVENPLDGTMEEIAGIGGLLQYSYDHIPPDLEVRGGGQFFAWRL